MCDNGAMAAVLRLFWGICLLRTGPELVPTRTWFLCGLLAAQLAMAVAAAAVTAPAIPPALALNASLIGIAVLASIAWFALYLRQLEARFPAVLGALLGTGLVIDAAYLAAHGVATGIARQGLAWLCELWEIVVAGFILHRALDCRRWAGAVLAFAAFAAAIVVMQAALGPALRALVQGAG